MKGITTPIFSPNFPPQLDYFFKPKKREKLHLIYHFKNGLKLDIEDFSVSTRPNHSRYRNTDNKP